MKWYLKTIVISASVLLLFLAISPVLSYSEETPSQALFIPKELPEDVKKIFEKGLSAAAAENWELAANYFDSISDDYWFYPPLMFNVGLTKANTGAELEAIGWLHAYMALVPETPHRESIVAEINRLKLSVDDKVMSIFKMLEKKARKMSKTPYSYKRDAAYTMITDAMAEVGFIEEAKKLKIAEIEEDYYNSMSYFQMLNAGVLAQVGDIEGAQNLLSNEEIATAPKSRFAWKSLAWAYAYADDRSMAFRALKNVEGSSDENDEKLLLRIVQKDLDEGDLIPVKTALYDIKYDYWRVEITKKLIAACIKQEEFKEAKQIFSAITHEDSRVIVAHNMAEQFWKHGHIDKAKEFMKPIIKELTAEKAKTSKMAAEDYERKIVTSLVLAGRFKEAKKRSRVMGLFVFAPLGHARTHALIARLQMYQGKLKDAKKTIKDATRRKDGDGQNYMVHAAVATIMHEQGNLDESIAIIKSIKTLPDGKYPWQSNKARRNVFFEVAEKRLSDGDVDGAMQDINDYYAGENVDLWKTFPLALDIAKYYKEHGEVQKAIELYKEIFDASLSWVLETDKRPNGARQRIEGALKDQFQIGIDSGELNEVAVQWVVYAIWVKHFGNIQTEINRSSKKITYGDDEPGKLIGRSARAAVEVKRFLMKANIMEKGNFDGSLQNLVSTFYEGNQIRHNY
jgi:tetratricopeptide (TPR) repeat protein